MKQNDYKDMEYLLLAFAILASDNEPATKLGVIGVYDMQDNERLVGVFNNSKNCANILGTNYIAIKQNICKKTLYKDRYRIERFKI